MKTLVIILDIVTGLLLFSTLVCGLWINAQPQVDPSSVKFHMSIAILTVALTVGTLIVSTIGTLRAV
jgi:hypothetical protein